MPEWVIFSVALAMALGTYAGGWRIIRTPGRRIVHLDPPQGFAAEATAASVLYATAFIWHVPISTTQTITSAVFGAGAHPAIVRGALGRGARNIVMAWILTLPGAALVAAGAYLVVRVVAGGSAG